MTEVERILLILLSVLTAVLLLLFVIIFYFVVRALKHSEHILSRAKDSSDQIGDIIENLKNKVVNPFAMSALSALILNSLKKYHKKQAKERDK